jgi:hypothetical protein
MPIFTIQTPGGKTLDIDAADEATAIRGAQEWAANNAGGMGAPAPAPNVSPFQLVDDFVRRTANAATFGFADKLAAKGDEITGRGGNYDQNIERERAQTKQAAANLGVPATLAADILGGVGGGLALGAVGASPLAYAGPSLTSRIGLGAAEGALQAGLQTFGESDKPVSMDQLQANAAQGGAIGAAVPVLGAAARRLITPFSKELSPEAARQAAVLAREGIELTPGQATGSQIARVAEDFLEAIPGGGGSPRLGKQQQQFTEAALRRAGSNAPLATAEALNENLARLQKNFDDISSKHIVFFDKTFDNAVSKLENKLAKGIVPEERGFVQEYLQDLGNLRNRVLTGSDYQALRSDITETINAYSNKPKVVSALKDIRRAIDDQAEKSIKRVSKDDWDLWQKTNREYAVQKTIERAVSAAGPDAASGIITPANLRSANRISGGRSAQARELGALGELSNAGVAILSPPPGMASSRSFTSRALGQAGLLGAGAAGVYSANEFGPAYGVASVAAPVIAGLTYFSPLGQKYLRNRVMPGAAIPASIQQTLTGGLVGLREPQEQK